jgi:tRNA (guanosine-2'-O-)-methyltransferase
VEDSRLRARERQQDASDPSKTTRFPRTTRRAERIQAVLRRRQPDLTVVLENVHDPHNVGAVLRSCDAVGVMHVHTIYSVEQRPDRAYARSSSGSARKWIDVTHHESVDACYEVLRGQGMLVLAAALTDDSSVIYDLELTSPLALVFGNEHRGVSDEALTLSDGSFVIPMMGMVESLNISVACAVSLYEAMRQRRQAGMYGSSRLSEPELARFGEEWLKR